MWGLNSAAKVESSYDEVIPMTDPSENPPGSNPANESPSVMNLVNREPSESSRDPVRLMMEIVQNTDISPGDRAALVKFASSRFKNRRIMAYICLYTIIASMALIFIGAFLDGLFDTNVIGVIKENTALYVWVDGFLTSIVGAYFGVSAWRPSS